MRKAVNTGIRRGQIEVIGAALLFAASVPANKMLLADVPPLALSGALYLSAGLFSALLFRYPGAAAMESDQNAIRGSEWGWLAAAVGSGGVLAPLFLFTGLRQVSGHAAGLLLNFEAVFTIAFGVLIYGERLGKRGWLGATTVVLGSLLLAMPGESSGDGHNVVGVALVVGACALWGLDNNLTQRVSLRDARQVVAVKGLIGGATSLVLAATFTGFGDWSAGRLVAVALVGALSFGLSIALFVRGLRQLGVLQTGTLFALAPGFAAVLSWIVLREPLRDSALASLVIMTAGAIFLASDRHEHAHHHEALDHVHEHEHDSHHQHEHGDGEVAGHRHTHPHRHQELSHAHPHAHDVHHRHR